MANRLLVSYLPAMISALLIHLGLGLLLGFRHAFEADHLAAVGSIVSQEKSPVRAAGIGACWGAGHLTTLLLVGIPVLALGIRMPCGLDAPLELGIAAMIVLLGVGGLRRSSTSASPERARPFGVGAAHGFAGSGALTLVILATMPSRMDGILYLGSFGLGSMLGMAGASALISVPIGLIGFGATGTARLMRAVSVASILFGMFYGGATVMATFGGHPA